MSVYKKLSAARKEFHTLKLTKTGHNKFANYYYFELGDFLIPGLQVFHNHDLCEVISFGKEMAVMTIVDIESNEKIEITSPMSTAALKGCHEVQNLGAVETYIRRYLWVTALEIVEHDALEATTGKDDKKAPVIPARPATETLGIDDDTQKYLQELSMECMGLVKEGKPDKADERIRSEKLDGDQEIALANMMDSASRTAITAARREWNKAQKANKPT